MERVAEWWETIFPGDVGGCCDGRDGIPVSFFILSHLSQWGGSSSSSREASKSKNMNYFVNWTLEVRRDGSDSSLYITIQELS